MCNVVTGSLNYATSSLVALTGSWTAADFCNVDLVVPVLSDVLTEDVAVIATPFEAAVCTAAYTVGVGAAISTAMDSLASTFGC